ncbi:uncharacterized protein LOC144862705 [Branchiostoma floridae x Branchiostoma japonicum]
MSYPTQQPQYPAGSAPPPIGFDAQPPPYTQQPMAAYPPPQGPQVYAGGKVAPMMAPQQNSQAAVLHPQQQVQYVQPTDVHVNQQPPRHSRGDDVVNCCLFTCSLLEIWHGCCWNSLTT